MGELRVDHVVREIKEAINGCRDMLEENELIISKVDIEMKTVFTNSPSVNVGAKVPLIDLKLEASEKHSNQVSNKIQMSFLPEEVGMEMMNEISEELLKGIESVIETIVNAKSSYPKFDLDSSLVELSFMITEEGKLSLLVSHEEKRENIHLIRLHIKEDEN